MVNKMNNIRRQLGVTLTEMTVVVGIAAALTVVSTPAIKTFFNSIGSAGETKSVISAAMSTAKSIAARQQRYAGIRFQCAYDPNNPLKASQYMIFIVHDSASAPNGTNLDDGFKAVEGTKPIKLSDNIGVADSIVRTNHNLGNQPAQSTNSRQLVANDLDNSNPANLANIYGGNINIYVNDIMSFSIIFSPAGKLVIHEVRVRNRNGDFQPANLVDSSDDIFNSPVNIVTNHTGMFIQDDYSELGLGAEFSRNSFVIFDRVEFENRSFSERYDYLTALERIYYINPYTGTIIDNK